MSRSSVISLLFLLLAALTGCNAQGPDPYEKSNRFFDNFNNGLDSVALKPLADGYTKVVPLPVRTCLGNGFDNLGYGNVIVNDLLQARWEQAAGDGGRMALNTTVGIAGLFDVATPCKLPKHDNDFGMTLARWNWADGKPGPYLVLPLFGPSCARDVGSIPVGILTDPVTWISPPLYVTIPLYTLEAVDARARAENEYRFRNQAALDPYTFTRNAYFQYRDNLIREGKPANNEDIYNEDFGPATSTAPATQPATRANSN